MPKTDDTLREDKSVFSMLEEWGAWAVAAGVIVEVIHAWIFREGKSPWEWLTPVVASGLIALGVIVEIVCARKAVEASDELDRRSNERVAEANARAQEAHLETERLRAMYSWRVIGDEAATKLVSCLRTAPAKVVVEFAANDPDSEHFALQIFNAFRSAQWDAQAQGVTVTGTAFWGLFVPGENDGSVKVIRDAFRAAGLDFSEEEVPGHRICLTGLAMQFGVTPKDGVALVTIGPKKQA